MVSLYIWPVSHIGWKTKTVFHSGENCLNSFKKTIKTSLLFRHAKETGWMLEQQCCHESRKRIRQVQSLTKYLLTLISSLPTQQFQVTYAFYFQRISSLSNFICGRCAGFYSWRNTTNGSWFVQALCYVLSERGREDDLLSLMTTVSRIVSIGFESNTPQDSNMHQRKQIPCITSLLTRKIYFKRKTTRRIWNNEKIALCVSSLKSTTVFHSFSSNNPVGIYALTNLRMHWLY